MIRLLIGAPCLFLVAARAAAAGDDDDGYASDDCGLWLGPSFVKEAEEHGFGLGMFTGKRIPEGTVMKPELLMPVYDYEERHHPPLREYLWLGDPLQRIVLDSADSLHVFLPGLASIAPCTTVNFNLEQIHRPKYDDFGASRDGANNATAGAFSYWSDQMFTAVRDILPGEELIVECPDDDFQTTVIRHRYDPEDPTLICLDDNVEERQSQVHGKGIFAKRRVGPDTVLVSSPMTPVDRSELEIWADEDKKKSRGKQLVLNYCYGHEDSELLWLPVSAPRGPSIELKNP